MSVKRAGPWAIVWRAVFATPFILAGLVSIAMGVQARTLGSVAFGITFVGTGAFVIWTGIREMRSAESRGTFTPPPVTRAPLGTEAFGGYRQLADTKVPSALEVYGSQLASLPVTKVTTGRGRTLAHALGRRDAQSGWVLVLFSIFWNVIVWPFFISAIISMSSGALFLLLFAIAGLIILFAGLKRVLALRKVVVLEIDAEPAFLGNLLTVHIAQRGPVNLVHLTAAIVCEERVSFSAGTEDTSREQREIYRQDVLDEKSVNVARGQTWTRTLQIKLPQGPASFHAPNNEIAWLIAIKAKIDGWPDYEEAFVFRALPKVAR